MTQREKTIYAYVNKKVKAWFLERPAPGHDFGHAERVAVYCQKLAKVEGGSVFLSGIIGLLHDIGRAIEKDNAGVTHHELSYNLCREWFRDDAALKTLSRTEKLNILFSVRNHWNNQADKYWEAVILRDADKLDMFGKIGLERGKKHRAGDWKILQQDFRFSYDAFYWIRTSTARKIAVGKKYIQWTDAFYKKLLRSGVKSVEL